jgi:hypothetical protein
MRIPDPAEGYSREIVSIHDEIGTRNGSEFTRNQNAGGRSVRQFFP